MLFNDIFFSNYSQSILDQSALEESQESSQKEMVSSAAAQAYLAIAEGHMKQYQLHFEKIEHYIQAKNIEKAIAEKEQAKKEAGLAKKAALRAKEIALLAKEAVLASIALLEDQSSESKKTEKGEYATKDVPAKDTNRKTCCEKVEAGHSKHIIAKTEPKNSSLCKRAWNDMTHVILLVEYKKKSAGTDHAYGVLKKIHADGCVAGIEFLPDLITDDNEDHRAPGYLSVIYDGLYSIYIRELERKPAFGDILPDFEQLLFALKHLHERNIFHGKIGGDFISYKNTHDGNRFVHLTNFETALDGQIDQEVIYPYFIDMFTSDSDYFLLESFQAKKVFSRREQQIEFAKKREIFALGMYFYLILTKWKQIPFEVMCCLNSSIQLPASGSPYLELTNQDVPLEVKQLIRQMLAHDYLQRPSAAEALVILESSYKGWQQRYERSANTAILQKRSNPVAKFVDDRAYSLLKKIYGNHAVAGIEFLPILTNSTNNQDKRLAVAYDGLYSYYIKQIGKPPTFANVLPDFVQLLSGLTHLHDMNIFHGEVAGDCILFKNEVDGRRFVHITHFENAVDGQVDQEIFNKEIINRWLTSSLADYFMIHSFLSGKKSLQREEQIEFAKKREIFAMGMYIYYVLTGWRTSPYSYHTIRDGEKLSLIPKSEDNYQELTNQDIPAKIKQLIRQMLTDDYRQRPTAEEALAILRSVISLSDFPFFAFKSDHQQKINIVPLS